MNTLEFIATMVTALIWPFTLFVAFLAFHKPILAAVRSVSRISHGDTAIEFDREAKEVGATLVAAGATTPAQQQRVESLATKNVARILRAWNELEDILRQRLLNAGIKESTQFVGSQLITTAKARALISVQQANSLRGLQTMRNLAVHSRDEISDERAEEFLVLASAVKTVLEIDFPKQVASNTSAAIIGQGELATMSYDDLKARLIKDFPHLGP